MCFHLEPQFRGAAGFQGPDASRLAGHGGGGGHRRPLRRHPGVRQPLVIMSVASIRRAPIGKKRASPRLVSIRVRSAKRPLRCWDRTRLRGVAAFCMQGVGRHLASSPGCLAADLREKRLIERLKSAQVIDISWINPERIGRRSARSALAEARSMVNARPRNIFNGLLRVPVNEIIPALNLI
jgi:hypothetical protein